VAPAPDLLAEHGVAVVFAWAFALQAGVPAPAEPMLMEPALYPAPVNLGILL
jgi:hypothetical protein